MHIPDGLMWPGILIIGWIVAIIVLAIAIKKGGATIHHEKVPTLAVLAAGIFVAQMLNFPVLGGTTGHLLGTTLAVLIAGPWAAIVVMNVVIITQGLLFGDGGILTMGLNLTNMAIVAVVVAYASLRLTRGLSKPVSVFISAWLSVFIAAVVCGIELAMSYAATPGEYGIIWTISLPSMAGYHSVIAIGEGLISTSVVAYFLKVAPELIQSGVKRPEAVAQ